MNIDLSQSSDFVVSVRVEEETKIWLTMVFVGVVVAVAFFRGMK